MKDQSLLDEQTKDMKDNLSKGDMTAQALDDAGGAPTPTNDNTRGAASDNALGKRRKCQDGNERPTKTVHALKNAVSSSKNAVSSSEDATAKAAMLRRKLLHFNEIVRKWGEVRENTKNAGLRGRENLSHDAGSMNTPTVSATFQSNSKVPPGGHSGTDTADTAGGDGSKVHDAAKSAN